MKAHGKTKEAIEATGGDPESDDTGGATSEDRRFGSGKPRLVQPIFEARGKGEWGCLRVWRSGYGATAAPNLARRKVQATTPS